MNLKDKKPKGMNNIAIKIHGSLEYLAFSSNTFHNTHQGISIRETNKNEHIPYTKRLSFEAEKNIFFPFAEPCSSNIIP